MITVPPAPGRALSAFWAFPATAPCNRVATCPGHPRSYGLFRTALPMRPQIQGRTAHAYLERRARALWNGCATTKCTVMLTTTVYMYDGSVSASIAPLSIAPRLRDVSVRIGRRPRARSAWGRAIIILASRRMGCRYGHGGLAREPRVLPRSPRP